MGEEFKIRDMTVLEEDCKKSIKVGEGKAKDVFVIKAPVPRERKQIARHIVIEQNGLPLDGFTRDSQFVFTRDAWLSVLIVESPEWWTNPDDCLDEGLKDSLYDELVTWDKAFQEKLKKNQFAKRGPETPVSG